MICMAMLLLAVAMLTGCGDDDHHSGGSGNSADDKEPVDEQGNGNNLLTQGDYLYKLFLNAKSGLSENAVPKALTIRTTVDGNNHTYVTTNEQICSVFASRLREVTIGKRNDKAAGDFSTVTLQWENDSESVLTLNAKGIQVSGQTYELSGYGNVWAMVDGLPKGTISENDLYELAYCAEQDFSFRYPAGASLEWQDGEGYYVGLDGGSYIPYVLLYRYKGVSDSPKDYLEKTIVPRMQKNYGSDMISVGETQEIQFENQTLYGVLFNYRSGEYSVYSFRVVGRYGDDLVNFTGKFNEGGDEEVYEAMELIIDTFTLGKVKDTGNGGSGNDNGGGNGGNGGNGGGKTTGSKDFEFKPSEAAMVTYEKYDNGLFSAEIPKGWVVKVLETSDYISYTFQIYNPDNPDLRVYFRMKTEGGFSTQEDYDFYASLYPTSLMAQLPVINPQTTESYFKVFSRVMDKFNTKNFASPTIKNFEQTASLGKGLLGAEIIRGRYTNEAGRNIEGVFSCSLMPYDIYYFVMQMVYEVTFFTAPENELVNWYGVLSHTLNSIEFSELYNRKLNEELIALGQQTMEIAQICSQMTDIVNSGWESRQAAYDRISQKQSDATLGYERVYDTDTKEIYEAPLDFFDYYHGDRYQAVTDNMYLLPIDGYIEWK